LLLCIADEKTLFTFVAKKNISMLPNTIHTIISDRTNTDRKTFLRGRFASYLFSTQLAGRNLPGVTGSMQLAGRNLPGVTGSMQLAGRNLPGVTGSMQLAGRNLPGVTSSMQLAGRNLPRVTGSLQLAGRHLPGVTGFMQTAGRHLLLYFTRHGYVHCFHRNGVLPYNCGEE
jgi:hypothetical protein